MSLGISVTLPIYVLQHSVNKYERMDADLLKKAREADTERKKKWKELTEMQDELSTLKKHNSVKIQVQLEIPKIAHKLFCF